MKSFERIDRAELSFVYILLPFTIGILIAYSFTSLHCLSYIFPGIICLLSYLFIVNIRYKQLNAHLCKMRTGILLNLFLFSVGCLSTILNKQSLLPDYYEFIKSDFLKIEIIDEPRNSQNIIWFNASVVKSYHLGPNKEPKNYAATQVSGKIRITVKKETNSPIKLTYGDQLLIPAKFTEVPPTYNPFEFDFKFWLAAQNVYHQTFLKQRELFKLNSNNGNKLISYALILREKQVSFYRKIIKNDDAFAVAATLILGYRSDLDAKLLNIYTKTGTIHTLSVSGMHVGLIYIILNWILSFLDRNKFFKLFKTLLILVLIWFYALLTGFSPSVLRSAIMLSVFIIAKLLARKANSYNILAFAAFCLLLYNPFLIWDVGFQLSFLSVFGLIYLQPKIYAWITFRNSWLDKIWGAAAMSVAAQLATYPLSIYYFHQFPIYFLISNLFIMLPVTFIMYIGIIILIFRIDSLGPLFEWLINFTNSGLDYIASLPFSGISSIWLSGGELALLCIALSLFIIALNNYKKYLLIISITVFFCLQSTITYYKIRSIQQRKTIRFRLKKNYAVAWIYSNSAIIYTDLSPESNIFKYSVKPALDQHRIIKIILKKLPDLKSLKDN